MDTLIWLDDVRNPANIINDNYPPYSINNCNVVWVKSYKEFVEWIEVNGLPKIITFDHDLGTEETGYDAVKWLANYCIEHRKMIPECHIHSSNPVGRANIQSIIDSFIKVYHGDI